MLGLESWLGLGSVLVLGLIILGTFLDITAHTALLHVTTGLKKMIIGLNRREWFLKIKD